MLKARNAYIESLRAQAKIVISLPPPRAEVSLDKTPVLGASNAPVVVVEYADYECPYCQQVAPTLQKLETEYKGKVAFAFKDTPLPMHPHAQKAAEAAHCAGVQGKYWEYHDLLFDSKKLEVADLKEDAHKLNLDSAAFDKCLDSGQEAQAVGAQYSESQRLGINGTPAFFINGRFLSGAASYDQLHAAIQQELTVAEQQPNQTASAAR
jgi:protein-disulfide isomerase